jgi:transposase
MMKNNITEAQLFEIIEARKGITDKKVDRRLRAAQLRGEGYKNAEISVMIEACAKVVSRWICMYVKGGAEALKKGEYKAITEICP